MNTDDLKPLKTFWEKPQGTPGMIGIGLLLAGGTYLLLKNAAWLAAAMANLTTAVLTGIGLFGLFWILRDKKVRNLIWYAYKMAIEKLTNVFIDIYPIQMARAYIGELKTKRKKMSQQLTNLKNEIGVLTRKISDTRNEIKKSMNLASVAKNKEGDRYKAQSMLHARKAGRRQNTAIKLSDLLKKMEKMYKTMDKMHYYSGIMIDDTSDQVDLLESERKMIYAGYSVMKTAQTIMAGNSDERDLFDRITQSVADDIGGKLGEMDRFMDLSQNFIDGVDLENGVFEMDGLAMLEEWEKGNTMQFLDEGTPNYLKVLNTISPQAEPILLSNEKRGENKKSKFFD
jgi:hypothetical protein